jgi:predicted CXXCH cytochrome family protein
MDLAVQFVGPAACTECHASIAESYAHTGMGRSFYPPDSGARQEDYADRNTLDLPAEGLRYEMTRRDGESWMRQVVINEAGEEIGSFERRIDYVMGSGNHSRSYVTEDDGAFFQMPVCWYTDKPGWDLCPGYELLNRHFTREADDSCLICHNARAPLVSGTSNQYAGKIPHGIDCEKCHGPGELHVARWRNPVEGGSEQDDTIVNPSKLSSPARMDVCLQCHLGDADASERVHRAGRPLRDFRPGRDLSEFLDVLTFQEPEHNRFGVGGQGDRFILSKCFQESGGSLDCLSCHNPHVTVYSKERPKDHFRNVCLSCHGVAACSVSEGERRRTTADDDCVVCHMRKSEPADHRFAALTDHWIRRKIDAPAPPSEGRDSLKMVGVFPEARKQFPWGEAHLNKGRALLTMKSGNVAGKNIPWKAPEFFLRKAVVQNPKLAEAWFLLGKTAQGSGNQAEAMGHFRRVLELDPDHRYSRLNLASALLALGRAGEAESMLEPLVAGSRTDMEALTDLGRAMVIQGDEQAGERFIREAADLSSVHAIPMANLGLLRARQGRQTEAAAALLEAGVREPSRPEIWAALADAYLQSGKPDAGVTVAKHLVTIRPDSHGAHVLLGRLLAASGDSPAAFSAYQRALELHPGSSQATAGLAALGRKPS